MIHDTTPPTREQLEARLRQQSMLADFGRRALTADDLDVLLMEAAVLAAQGLDTDMSKVMELAPLPLRMEQSRPRRYLPRKARTDQSFTSLIMRK